MSIVEHEHEWWLVKEAIVFFLSAIKNFDITSKKWSQCGNKSQIYISHMKWIRNDEWYVLNHERVYLHSIFVTGLFQPVTIKNNNIAHENNKEQ